VSVAADQPVLTARGLRRTLGDRSVLSGADLSVRQGELVTLVGPSGCGKSTLLRAVAGLEPLDAGSVFLDGHDVTGAPPERRGVGMVFQHHALFGHLRVDRNVAFGLRHLPRAERAERVDELLRLVKLAHLARRYPHQLSGGEQQRVALARAMAPRPSVVLLDEPFGALDEGFREELGWEVKAILAAQRTAAVLVTHDRREALALGDRVAVMHGGVIAQCAEPRVVYEFPADRFVADFIAASSYVETADGSEILVRPHRLRVVAGGPCTVMRREFLGWTHRYTVADGRGRSLVADVGPGQPLQVGDACTVLVIEE